MSQLNVVFVIVSLTAGIIACLVSFGKLVQAIKKRWIEDQRAVDTLKDVADRLTSVEARLAQVEHAIDKRNDL